MKILSVKSSFCIDSTHYSHLTSCLRHYNCTLLSTCWHRDPWPRRY